MIAKRRKEHRRGSECVETALTLPLLLLVMVATVGITHEWHVAKMLKLATYEAIRAGCMKDGDADDALAVFQEHAQALGINDAELVIDRKQFNNAKTGDLVELTATAPANKNQVIVPFSLNFRQKYLTGGRVFYRKEGL